MILQILNGAISASWVLAGVVSMMCFLLWRMLSTMQSDIKTLTEIINRHDKLLDIHAEKLEYQDQAYRSIVGKNEKLAEEIIVKLRIANQLK
jgi:hypothetical protein